jgi:hypothetical protein
LWTPSGLLQNGQNTAPKNLNWQQKTFFFKFPVTSHYMDR